MTLGYWLHWSSDELFVSFYEEILEKIKAGNDTAIKSSRAIRMRKLLMLQSEFIINEWLKTKRESEAGA